ncbi:MAG: MFS transporter [bacterium]|nr:MFS transporter [bacterium]
MSKTWGTIIATGMAGLIVGIDFTIVNTALSNIASDLHTTIGELQWVMTGFGLFLSAFMVAMGRLADLKGRKKVLYLGIIGFGLGSLGAGLAQSPLFLIIMRMLQGISGAAIIPAGMAIVLYSVPQEQRGRALSIYTSLLGIGMAFGPVVGSVIMTITSWHWIFFINIPIVLVSLIICFAVVDESKQSGAIPIDWPGVINIVLAVGLLIFAITLAPIYGWDSAMIIFCFVASIVAFLALIAVERHAQVPLIPINIFLNRGFLTGMLVYFAGPAIAWSVIFIMPLYLHTSLGFSTGIVGLILFLITIMTVIAPPIAGHYFDKNHVSLVIHSTFVSGVLSLFLFTQLGPNGPLWLVIIAFILFGATWGMSNGIAPVLAISKLSDTQDSGLVSGGLLTMMNIAAIVILAFDTTLFGYAKNISFIHGVHLSVSLLLLITVCLWIAATFIYHGKSQPKSQANQ